MPIILGPLDKRTDPARVISPSEVALPRGVQMGRALDLQNIDFRRRNEPERRKGFIRRLHVQNEGAISMLFQSAGLCGRFFEYEAGGGLLYVGGDGIRAVAPEAQDIDLEELASLGASRVDGANLAWTYADGTTERNTGCDGAKILRRSDAYPTAHDDPAADLVYDGGLAAAADSGIGTSLVNYYSGFAVYPSGGYSVVAEALLNSWVDMFTRSTLGDDAHPWADLNENSLRMAAGRVRNPDSGLGEAHLPGLYVGAEDPLTVSGLIYLSGFGGTATEWRIGIRDPSSAVVPDPRNYAVVQRTIVPQWALTVWNADGSSTFSGWQNEEVPSGSRLTVRRAGNTLTARFAGQEVSVSYVALPDNAGPFLGLLNDSTGFVEMDHVIVQAV